MFSSTTKRTRTLLFLLVLCLALPIGSASAKQEPKPLVNPGDPINILVMYAPFDPKTDHSVVVLEEVLGFDLEFDMLPEQNGMDKLNLIFSSGDVPYDLIIFTDKSLYTTYAQKNLLMDLTDELPKYENLMKIDQQGQGAIEVNGRVHGIASTGLPYTGSTTNIRLDWLDQLGLEIPTTREELYDVLVAFKEQDPGNVGEDLIPLISGAAQFLTPISATFGFLYPYEERDGKIADIRLSQEYLDYLTFMNQLYNEKLLDPDMPVNIGSTINEKVAAGRVGVHMGGTDQPRFLWVAEKEKNPDIPAPMDIIEPLKDANGVQAASSLSGLHKISVIPRTTQKLDMVLSFLDAFREDANYQYIIHGDEGIDFEMIDGEPVPLVPAFDVNRGNLYHLSPLQDGEFYFPLWKMRTRKTVEGAYLFAKTFEKAGDFLVTNPIAFAPAIDTISQELRAVNEYATQEAVKFVAGARPLSEFEQFVDEMNQKGAQKIVDAYNEWYLNK